MWIIKFLTSSIGRKLVMSLTGLFLILFLTVHLIGNLQLLKNDGGEAFNSYAYMMTHNPLIFLISLGNYFFIVLHAIVGILLYFQNRGAKGTKYAVSTNASSSWGSKNMALLGSLILAFLFIHMGDFWFKMKMGEMFPDGDWIQTVQSVSLGHEVANLYEKVAFSFSQLWIVIVYLIGLIILGFHLNHGFASAFQSMGINHKKYTPIIKGLGKVYSIIVPLGFATMPIYFYFFK